MWSTKEIDKLLARKVVKGDKYYLTIQKIEETRKTVVLFFLCTLLLLCSHVTVGVDSNLFLLVCVLGALPTAKEAVETIMYLRYSSMDSDAADGILARLGNGPITGLFDLVFTTHHKNYQIDHMVYHARQLYGYTTHASVDVAKCEEHLNTMLVESGQYHMKVQIFKDINEYYKHIDFLKGVSFKEDHFIKSSIYLLLKCISL